MGEITWLDYVLLPFYLPLIYKVAFYYRNKFYPEGHPYRPYFITGLSAKIGGAIFIGLIYNYYYGGGDTFNFFYHSQIINSTFGESPASWFRLITHQADQSNLIDAQALSQMYWYDDMASYTTACLGAFIGIFCFTRYLVINVIMAAVTFTGAWLMFITFAQQYKYMAKYIAVAVLFIPGPVIWGSGLFKDSFCMLSIGCLVYSLYILLEKRELKAHALLLLAISAALLITVKAYILVTLLPVVVIKVILVYQKKLTGHPEKRLPFYIALSLVVFAGMILIRKVAMLLSAYSLENVLETIKHQKDYLLRVSLDEDGSAYNLGDFEPTLSNMLGKFWPAVNVTLFRPYLWESRSIIQLFSAIESAAILLFTLYVLFSKSIFKTIRAVLKDPNLIMCLLFTLLFAFIVGISTYNFGSLSRYKIPCTPFYILFLVILLFKDKPATADGSHEGVPSATNLL